MAGFRIFSEHRLEQIPIAKVPKSHRVESAAATAAQRWRWPALGLPSPLVPQGQHRVVLPALRRVVVGLG
jgi:hypothetical protein